MTPGAPSAATSPTSSTGAPLVTIEQVSYRYRGADTKALDGVSIDIRRGSLFGLLGINGSGKTTLLSILAGIREPDAGRIVVDGLDLVSDRSAVQGVTAFVPQENAFYPTLTVLENLEFFAALRPLPVGERRVRVEGALAAADLAAMAHRRAAQLSGGMQRRLSVAIGLLHRPRLLLLDEPTVGLDPHSRHFLLDEVRGLHAAGTTIVYSSHHMEEVRALCDDVAILHRGARIAQGNPRELAAGRAQRLRIETAVPLSAAQLAAIASLPTATASDTIIELAECLASDIDAVLGVLRSADVRIASMTFGAPGLEDIFLALTDAQAGVIGAP